MKRVKERPYSEQVVCDRVINRVTNSITFKVKQKIIETTIKIFKKFLVV